MLLLHLSLVTASVGRQLMIYRCILRGQTEESLGVVGRRCDWNSASAQGGDVDSFKRLFSRK